MAGPPLPEPFPGDFFEVAVGRLPLGNLKARELKPVALEVHLDSLGDREGIVVGLLVSLEERRHLLGGFEVELIPRIPHPVLVLRLLSRPDAEQDVVRFGVVLRDVVAVVGRDRAQPLFLREGEQTLVDRLLVGKAEAVVLNLEKEIVRSQDVSIDARGAERRRLVTP